jgi:hypothetical protein
MASMLARPQLMSLALLLLLAAAEQFNAAGYQPQSLLSLVAGSGGPRGTACSRTSECAIEEYCALDSRQPHGSCYTCRWGPFICDTVDYDCCSPEFLHNCPSNPHGCPHGLCELELTQLCAAEQGDATGCAVCAGTHQHPLRKANCSHFQISDWCGQPAAQPTPLGFGKVDSRIAGATAAGLAFVEAALPKESQKGEWRLCYDSRTDCTSCPSDSSPDGSSPCSCAANATSFHGACDARTETLVLGHNTLARGLGKTFGGYAMATWSCCQPGSSSSGSYATGATGNFLFQLGPDAAATYPARGPNGTPRGDNCYQHRAAGYWPIWGSDDLKFGFGGALGNNGYCNRLHQPGYTYEGLGQEVCGGNYNWGPTQMEVWYRV